MDRSSYENVRAQLGHCGLWCWSCIVGNGLMAEMTSRCEGVVCGHGVHNWVLKENGGDFMEALDTIKKAPICPGCLKGGGDDSCRMRESTKKNGLVHWDECNASNEYPHIKIIAYVREGGRAAGMLAATCPEERVESLTGDFRSYFDDYPGILFKEHLTNKTNGARK